MSLNRNAKAIMLALAFLAVASVAYAVGENVEWFRAGFASQAFPLPVDGPQIDTPRTGQTACAATATVLDSLACTSTLIINRVSTSTESCFVGGATVATGDGFELTGSNGFDERVTNANIFSCISATNNCSVSYLCGDVS